MATERQTITPGAPGSVNGWTRISQNKTLVLEIEGGGAVKAHIALTGTDPATVPATAPGHLISADRELNLATTGWDVFIRSLTEYPVTVVYTAI